MSIKLIKRDILDEIVPWLGKEKILIIKGARQVGKTTILRQLKKHIEKKFPNDKLVYIVADDLENQPIFSSRRALENYISRKTGFPEGFTFLFIDEFQYISQAGQFLKNIFDKYKDQKNLQIIVSGSSSLEITKNQEFLTGRALEFMVERISFKEFFVWKEQTINKTMLSLNNFEELELFYNNFKISLENLLNEYLIFGGYPEVLTTKMEREKKIILSSIIKTYLEKDVVNFLRVENVSAFNGMLRILSEQIGNMVNISKLSDDLGISAETVRKYLDIMEGTYIFKRVLPYHKNIRKEIVKMPKIYLLDLGIKSYFSRSWNFDNVSGEMAENFVYLSLKTKIENDDILFYRTKMGTEIDFVVKTDDSKINLIESKYRNHLRANALKSFKNKYPNLVKYSIVITKNILKKKEDIYYIPATLLPFVKY
ncbi:MAG TPA: ATP-binding protein [Candidatus Moranbacteria bacterium]|nr:ATP-binding protein [Candidatus Moranbacteria bacterium]